MHSQPWEPYLEAARALHARYPVIDGHCDSVLNVDEGKRRLTQASDIGHLDFVRARQAGLSGQIFALWPLAENRAARYYHEAPARRTLVLLDCLQSELAAAPELVRPARTAADIQAAYAEGLLAALIGIEGGEALEGELAMLRTFYRLGVRVIGLVWNGRNELADGAQEWESGSGLTRFGRAVVKEMNRLGMVVDTAHLSPTGFFDVLETSEQPVLFSHGNCRALRDHLRNLTDEQIRALAEQGGVFGISFVNPFLVAEGRSTIATVADHIEHACAVVGSAAHVALGTDYDGCEVLPEGLEQVSLLPRLTAELLRRGFREPDLAGILGGNYLRVFRTVLKEEQRS